MSTERQKNKKGPLSHQKIKCSFLDYVQLLMIGWAIQAENVNWNVKKWKRPPKSSKNKIFVFGLRSTSDDRLSDLSKKRQPKCKKKKGPLSHSKNKMFIFGLCSTSWWLANLVNGWTPSATPLQPKNEMLIFGLRSTSDDLPGWSMDLNPICHPSPAKKMKCSFLEMFNFWWSVEQSKQRTSTETH